MADNITYVGMDTHKATISVAVAEPDRSGEVRFVGKIINDPVAIGRFVRKLSKRHKRLRFSYEAGPCGYGLYRQLRALGHDCIVAAPSLIPRAPGERVQTDRLDAMTLAKTDRAGDLTAIWVPDETHEAMRDLVRGREAAMIALKRARQQLLSFLLRQGRVYSGLTHWTRAHERWLDQQRFEHAAHHVLFQEMREAIKEAQARRDRLDDQVVKLSAPWDRAPVATALTALRGIAQLSAATLVAEIGNFTRFSSAPQLMDFIGLVPSESSTGKQIRRGPITRAGNSRVRRLLTEAAWHYTHKPCVGGPLRERQRDLPKEIRDIAWKAQLRLCSRYTHLRAGGKLKQVAIIAIAREMLGFIWDIACRAEQHAARSAA